MGKPGGSDPVTSKEERTRGTETSQYPEEEKSTEITQVAASERVPSPNRFPLETGVVGPTHAGQTVRRSPLEWGAKHGDSPVADDPKASSGVPE